MRPIQRVLTHALGALLGAAILSVVAAPVHASGPVPAPAASSSNAPPAYDRVAGRAQDGQVVVEAERATRGGEANEAGAAGGPATEKYFRATPEQCALFHGLDAPDTDLSRGCGENRRKVPDALECAPDSFYLGALYRQTRTVDANGLPGAWSTPGDPVADQTCLTPADLAAEAERALVTLQIAPSPLTVQPPDGWTLVNVPTITYTSNDPQELTTTLLGVPVTIRVHPGTYTWDYGDRTPPRTTTDPGAPYPEHTVHHTYLQAADQASITLTTTWTARFRIIGAPTWTPLSGTATTTTTAPPLTVHEARSRLVTDPLP